LRTWRIFAALLIIAMLIAPAAQTQTSRAQSEATLRQLEQELVAAAARNDWHFWDQVVAPEWTCIDQFGQLWDKPAILLSLKNRKGSIQSARLNDVQVRFFKDDVAMVTGSLLVVGSASGKTIKITNRSTDILVQRQGKWLVVASQVTPMRQAS
jgi:hypothetical protein